ncbi:conserved hypothetical protein [Flavobacterium sp. 9AF]|uniref:hypothetical protein n=1 Tax=Flavobacterium sp. 9AF TaxID=2653142 RepID=UPI0012EF92BF|nr:hypothetical protein [Flavobacterium sp. 9AF]VXC39600.1 conserved hypothetical protein [Flavobacterium sp. 9AF]
MGRRNETNRKAHKKKADDKKIREREAKNSLKEKRKAIVTKFNQNKDESGQN